jgi:hypothetical protein
MRYLLKISLITLLFVLEGCDERINPDKVNIETIDELTKFELLTAHPWQYNEVTLKGGGQTIVQFSRPNATTFISEISTQKDTYKTDGGFETTSNVKNRVGLWKFSADENQLILTEGRITVHTFDIVSLTEQKFDFTETITKASIGDETLWTELLKRTGLPASTTEFTTTYSQIPL